MRPEMRDDAHAQTPVVRHPFAARNSYRAQPFVSHLSFALASRIVCHCMFEGASGPPHASGTIFGEFIWYARRMDITAAALG
jgi:hypothetical protein